MAIIWNKIIPRWGGDTIEPPEAKKDIGYIAGDKPPAKWENWLRKGTYEALDETRDVIEGIDSQVAQDMQNLTEHVNNFSTAHGIDNKVSKFGDTMVGGLVITASTRLIDLKPDQSGGWTPYSFKNFGGNDIWRATISVPTENNLSFNNILGTGELQVDGNRIYHAGNTGGFYTGNGSPEGTVTAPIGSVYQRKDGGESTTLYVKQSGTGNTGWVAK